MKILAIGAHPDDIELFMYGLLAECKLRGDDIFAIVATDGALGDVRKKNKIINLTKTRSNETKAGLKNLCIPEFLCEPDGKLSCSFKTKNKIQNYIEYYKPDLIVTHDENDYHPDHRILSKMVVDTAGTKFPVIFAETLLGINFIPDFYIDITKVFNEKKLAIMCHFSQIPERFVEAIEIQNRFRAAQCNAPSENYAECYRASNGFPYPDIRDMLPKAPQIREFFLEDSDALL